MVTVHEELASSLLGTIKFQIIKGDSSTVAHSGQFAVLYLHPSDAGDKLQLIRNDEPQSDIPSPYHIIVDKDTIVWPADSNTNIAAAMVQYGRGLRGHSEYLLLQKLVNMIEFFKVKKSACPSYVIIASLNAPCHKAADPKRPPLGCTTEIINKFGAAQLICPEDGTTYVVAYQQIKPENEDEWEAAKVELGKAGILLVQVYP